MKLDFDSRRVIAAAGDESKPRVLPPITRANPADLNRRRKIGPVGFSHCAFRSHDLEATRHFYEDLIGLPLVVAEKMIQEPDPATGKLIDGIHFFFELADGSSIGFFGLEKAAGEPHQLPHNPLEHHFAVQVETEDFLREIEDRVLKAGFKCAYIDHGSCLSLYIDDPDGVTFELVHHRDAWFANIDTQKARARLDEWIANGERWVNQDEAMVKVHS